MLDLFDELEFRSLGARARTLFGAVHVVETKEEDGSLSEADPQMMKEVIVAFWLLSSETTNPQIEDVLRATKKDSVEKAHTHLLERLADTGRLKEVFDRIEKPLIPIVDNMHTVGIALDVDYLKNLSKEYHTELSVLEKRVYKHAGKEFNINSPAQLGKILFEDLALTIPRHKKTGTGKPSTPVS